MCKIIPRKRTIAVVAFIVLLVVYCGVTEFALCFIVTPWIRYAEFWLKYFTLVYAAVASIIAYYLAKVIPNSRDGSVGGIHQPCWECRACRDTNGANCEQDPVPTTSPGPGNNNNCKVQRLQCYTYRLSQSELRCTCAKCYKDLESNVITLHNHNLIKCMAYILWCSEAIECQNIYD